MKQKRIDSKSYLAQKINSVNIGTNFKLAHRKQLLIGGKLFLKRRRTMQLINAYEAAPSLSKLLGGLSPTSSKRLLSSFDLK